MSSDPVVDVILHYSEEFDLRTKKRHEEGSKKYGELKFLGADVIEELCQELLDQANYARYQYIKLKMLQVALGQELENRPEIIENTLGVASFRSKL